jgi:hypothetical protein
LGGKGPTANTWANNVFSYQTGVIIQDMNDGTKWLGNVHQGTLGVKPFPGMKLGSPKFAKRPNDIFRPTINSSTRNTGTPGFDQPPMYSGLTPANPISRDFMNVQRPSKITAWDIGAMQYQKNLVPEHLSNARNVGPSYLRLA